MANPLAFDIFAKEGKYKQLIEKMNAPNPNPYNPYCSLLYQIFWKIGEHSGNFPEPQRKEIVLTLIDFCLEIVDKPEDSLKLLHLYPLFNKSETHSRTSSEIGFVLFDDIGSIKMLADMLKQMKKFVFMDCFSDYFGYLLGSRDGKKLLGFASCTKGEIPVAIEFFMHHVKVEKGTSFRDKDEIKKIINKVKYAASFQEFKEKLC